MNMHLFKKTLGVLLITLLSACGGGGGGGSASNGGIGGTGVATGPITGFGSVFVNGIEFDTSGNIQITLDGEPNHSQSDLKIGQVVTIKGTISDDGTKGTATSIEFEDEVEGPVQSIDLAANTIVVLGLTVQATATTVFDGFASLAALAVNDIVEVSGLPDATGKIVATHIEKHSNYVAGTEIEVKGMIANLTATTFTIGTLTVDYSLVLPQDRPATLSNGLFVEVKANTLPDPITGVLTATKVEVEDEDEGAVEGNELDLEGFVTDFVSATEFKVNGQAVTTNFQTSYEHGVAADLANNVRVEVEGRLTGGVLVAEEISFED